MNWINARIDPPQIFGKYFVKINNVKHIIDFHEFDFYLERGEEVFWLHENIKSLNFTPIFSDYPDTQFKPFTDKERDEVKKLKEKIIVLESRLNHNIKIISVSRKLKEECINHIDLPTTKEEVKKFLSKGINHSYVGFNLKIVKRLFPQIRRQNYIPDDLKQELINVYTEEGFRIIEFKFKRSQSVMKSVRKHKEEAVGVKESNCVDHFKETMKHIGIEFELMDYDSLVKP